MKVVAQQGESRYLIDLELDDGSERAQIADLGAGKLFPPMLIHSILARGYWEEPQPDAPTAEMLLTQVRAR